MCVSLAHLTTSRRFSNIESLSLVFRPVDYESAEQDWRRALAPLHALHDLTLWFLLGSNPPRCMGIFAALSDGEDSESSQVAGEDEDTSGSATASHPATRSPHPILPNLRTLTIKTIDVDSLDAILDLLSYRVHNMGLECFQMHKFYSAEDVVLTDDAKRHALLRLAAVVPRLRVLEELVWEKV
ncbi:hypothetical protein OF83DRAFT_1137965 [Amylostereum chailletii]|nr:hypothetical protein OF83DRAFT_1137965 [Amylostereum chailletii]